MFPDIPLTSFNNLWFPAPRSYIADFIPHFQHEFNNPIIVGLILFHRFHKTIPKSLLHCYFLKHSHLHHDFFHCLQQTLGHQKILLKARAFFLAQVVRLLPLFHKRRYQWYRQRKWMLAKMHFRQPEIEFRGRIYNHIPP